MRRADRLFQIVQLLRRSRATTAARLAAELLVSERTIYRDVQDLVASGVPIQGEAGVGYALPPRFDLPPLMFDAQEIEALALGARMVQCWSDEQLARAARSALAKIENVLPERLAVRLEDSKLFVPDFHVEKGQHAAMAVLRQGLDESRVVRLDYADESWRQTRRDVRPLGLFYWGKSWTLTGWCELRTDFRTFRLDRIDDAKLLARRFAAEPGKGLEDFLARMRAAKPAKPEPAESTEQEQRAACVDRTEGTQTDGKPGERLSEREALRELQRLGSVGPASAGDLVRLGFRSVAELHGQDPGALYRRLCEITGTRQDPCVEDVLRCAIAQAEDPGLPQELRLWYRWTGVRGQPPGTRPG